MKLLIIAVFICLIANVAAQRREQVVEIDDEVLDNFLNQNKGDNHRLYRHYSDERLRFKIRSAMIEEEMRHETRKHEIRKAAEEYFLR